MVLLVALVGCELAVGAERPQGVAHLTAVEDLRIDGYEHDLVPINWLGVAPDGRIALLQRQDDQVRFFDSEGEPLATVGRRGEGPGEFTRMVRAGWVGDTLWVSDTQQRRTTLIGPDGEVVRTERNHAVAEPAPDDRSGIGRFLNPTPYAFYGDGGSLVWGLRLDETTGALSEEGPPLLRLTSDGTIRAVMARVPSQEGSSVRARVGGGFAFAQVPFFGRARWRVSPDGSLFAHLSTRLDTEPQPTYRVVVFDAAGTSVFDRSYPFEPGPIPSHVIDSAIVASASSHAAVSAELEAELNKVAPAIYSEAERLAIGDDGRIWIGMRARGEERRWQALSASGEPEAEVVLPRTVTLWAADEAHLWGVDRDELDVESAVRYRIDG